MSDQAGRVQRGLSPAAFVGYVLIGALLGALAGSAVGLLREDAYVASSTVLVTPLEGNPYSPIGSGDDLLNLETEAQLVVSDAVTLAVAEAVGEDAQELQDRVTVEVPENTQILRVSYRDPDEDTAVDSAQAFAEVYLDNRVERSESALSRQNQDLGGQIRALNRDLRSLNAQRRQGGDAVGTVTRERITALTTQIVELQTERAQLRETALDPGQVVNPAIEGTRFPLPSWSLGLLAGLVVGALLGAFAGVAVNNRRLRRASDDPVGAPG